MDKEKNINVEFIKKNLNIEATVYYKANAFCSIGGYNSIKQGYVVDNYFIEKNTMKIYPKSYFYMINNIEDDENM